jgi:SAM-dependent methyltransferase
MKQNIYDDTEFFAKYSAMDRSQGGLEKAGEWYAFRSLLPSLDKKRVLDLGCGFGWHCRYVKEQGASSVLGIDLSEKMLTRARELTSDSAIEYRQSAIEEADLPQEEFELVLSSLAFHYLENWAALCSKVFRALVKGGSIVFSVEHPIFTAVERQDWHYGSHGRRLHWPVDNYMREGKRITSWLTNGVVKYHRTLATYINGLLGSGFQIERVLEPGPSKEMLSAYP